MSWKVAAKKGVNRKYWGFTFPLTKAELATAKAHLEGVVRQLEAAVKSPELSKKLMALKEALGKTESRKDLNEVRKQLTEYFSGYAGGRPFFGSKLAAVEAKAGRYKVKITGAGLATEGWIELREDPLLKD